MFTNVQTHTEAKSIIFRQEYNTKIRGKTARADMTKNMHTDASH